MSIHFGDSLRDVNEEKGEDGMAIKFTSSICKLLWNGVTAHKKLLSDQGDGQNRQKITSKQPPPLGIFQFLLK